LDSPERILSLDQALAELAARYPSPWIVGWWRDLPDGRCGLEATKRLGRSRFARVHGAGAGWTEALADVR
jgi:hypothetical protein